MARAVGSLKSIASILPRNAKANGQLRSEFSSMNQEVKSQTKKIEEKETSCYWTPDGRTGIYVPRGHESVMDNVPEGAASLKQTYWLRNVEGVDKPDSSYDFHI